MIPDAFCLPPDVQIALWFRQKTKDIWNNFYEYLEEDKRHLESFPPANYKSQSESAISRCLLSSSRCSDCTLHLKKLP